MPQNQHLEYSVQDGPNQKRTSGIKIDLGYMPGVPTENTTNKAFLRKNVREEENIQKRSNRTKHVMRR